MSVTHHTFKLAGLSTLPTCNTFNPTTALSIVTDKSQVTCKKCLAALEGKTSKVNKTPSKPKPIKIISSYRPRFDNYMILCNQGNDELAAVETTDPEAAIAELLIKYPGAKVERW